MNFNCCRDSKLVFISLLAFATCASIKNDSPVVQISSGQVKGTSRTNFDGDNFWAYLSIPYAKPPLEKLRFKAPLPVEPWEGVKDVTKQGPDCPQYLGQLLGSEDCLHLHVFTKNLPTEESKLKPVMVYIPGGAFISGSNTINLYGPDFLMTEDIVLVTVSYRLGILGFLSLEDPTLDVPGNAGLKDQVLALKWVQENIKHFNGDPNNVTLFGESAGGVSVDYLVLSSTTKNLFQRAIIQSGTTLTNWARSRFVPEEFGKYIGHPNLSESEFLDLLSGMSAADIVTAQISYSQIEHKYGGLYAPVVEKPNPTAIITQHPIDIIKSGKYNSVPLILGFNSNEGLLLETNQYKRDIQWPLSIFLPFDTDMKDPDQVKGMYDIMTEFYTREENKNDSFMLPTDGLFISPIITSALNYAKVSKDPVYIYRFALDAGLNLLKKLNGLQEPGACHGDEIGYLFTGTLPLPTGDVEKTAVRRIVELWTNFAKYGNPTPADNDLNIEWKPVQPDNIEYLNFDEELTGKSHPEPERLECWAEIYKLNNITAKFL